MRSESTQLMPPRTIGAGEDPSTRKHQGIPGVERLSSGRLYAVYYTGTLDGEGPGNYVVLTTSTDDGRSWREIQVVGPQGNAAKDQRAFDSTLWLDPTGRLWWFWSQEYSNGLWDISAPSNVWAAICDAPDTDSPQWSTPRRIGAGIMLNKPTVLDDGTWLLPTSVWTFKPEEVPESLRGLGGPNLLRSRDQGHTFEFLHVPQAPQDVCLYDEHWTVQLSDGSLMILLRTKTGPWLTRSNDGGSSWTTPEPAHLGSVNSRFVLRKLRSGRLLFVFHHTRHALPGCPIDATAGSYGPRENITAWLSEDDGKSWRGQLTIDPRTDISYPDVTEGDDGFLYLIYDRKRRNLGQILLARFTENDILAGEMLTPGSFASSIVAAFPTVLK